MGEQARGLMVTRGAAPRLQRQVRIPTTQGLYREPHISLEASPAGSLPFHSHLQREHPVPQVPANAAAAAEQPTASSTPAKSAGMGAWT